jgi:long-chain acyl-CoA synthetase
VEGERRLTFGELRGRSFELAAGLRGLGLRWGDRVAYLGHNSLACLECYFGVPAAGMVLLPLNWRLAADELAYILGDAECAAVIVGAGFEEAAAEATAGLDLELIHAGDGATPSGWHDFESLFGGREVGDAGVGPDDVAYLYYTSGTTGRPKGCMLTHRSVAAGSLSACATVGLHGHHTWLHAGPMFHLGDAWAIWGLMMQGGKQVMMHFEPEQAVEAVAREHVTHTLLVPTALDMFSEAAAAKARRLTSFEAVIYGGAPMPPPLYDTVKERLGAVSLVHTYGITETSGVCTCLQADEHLDAASGTSRIASIGRETPLVDIDIVDDRGAPIPVGEVGEIRVTSPAVMRGYWGKEEQTAEVLSGSSYLTGDLGRRDEEGFLWLTDRKKDMIISGGENVYALEVERVLSLASAVDDVAVVGAPHERWGECVCAVLQVAPGQSVTLEELQDFARRDLAGYKIPRRMLVVESLPRTGTGKIDKASVRMLVREGG